MIIVRTKGATYLVDRENWRWKRTLADNWRADDGVWISGGFTLGDVGESCFAHYEERADGAIGRNTSRVVSIEETA